MQKSDFPSNYTGLYGRGNYLHRELLMLLEHAEQHPATAAQLLSRLTADVNVIAAGLGEAANRTQMSGPNGGPRPAPALVSIDVTPATVSIAVGATQQLTVAKTPSGAAGTAAYASSDATKATVSASGLVTGVAAGSATITVTVGSKTDTSVITVTAP